MTRTDSLVVGALVVLLAVVAGLVGPCPTRAAVDGHRRADDGDPGRLAPYREGVLGRPVSITPF